MALTLEDIKDRLKKLDEVTLCEILEIDSEELVDRFPDKVEDKIDYFEGDLEDEHDE